MNEPNWYLIGVRVRIPVTQITPRGNTFGASLLMAYLKERMDRFGLLITPPNSVKAGDEETPVLIQCELDNQAAIAAGVEDFFDHFCVTNLVQSRANLEESLRKVNCWSFSQIAYFDPREVVWRTLAPDPATHFELPSYFQIKLV